MKLKNLIFFILLSVIITFSAGFQNTTNKLHQQASIHYGKIYNNTYTVKELINGIWYWVTYSDGYIIDIVVAEE